MARLVRNGTIPTLPLYNLLDVQGQFYLAGIEPDNLHRFTNSSLKSYMKNQLTRVTRCELTCTTCLTCLQLAITREVCVYAWGGEELISIPPNTSQIQTSTTTQFAPGEHICDPVEQTSRIADML